jgi:uncharacterized protein (DUF433 family)
MDWRERIHRDPRILGGKPVVKGTRLDVGFILELLQAGCAEDEILRDYPQLTREGIEACRQSARDGGRR